MSKPRLRWRPEEKLMLVLLIELGNSAAEIAKEMLRSRASILNQARRMKLRLGGGANWKRVPYRKIGRGRIAL